MLPPFFVGDSFAHRRAATIPARHVQWMLTFNVQRSFTVHQYRGSVGDPDWPLPARPTVCLLIAAGCARLVADGNRRNGSTISNNNVVRVAARRAWKQTETNSHFGIKIVI